eukprot:gnl/TRDRNA2_/TRDRNA2_188601_c0_seq1.p1 gnl/TRDRNA2_/TRDRNA2_188601_c0~~gnl/TRDRNA2_/TRDRNA2_188601_c0_seq1.p1  ORF type:complete len:143 (+),score=19.85 gnl/TRDRNA2_/TRDRNA2_188601_c0_seq1:57-485(+)
MACTRRRCATVMARTTLLLELLSLACVLMRVHAGGGATLGDDMDKGKDAASDSGVLIAFGGAVGIPLFIVGVVISKAHRTAFIIVGVCVALAVIAVLACALQARGIQLIFPDQTVGENEDAPPKPRSLLMSQQEKARQKKND